MPNPWAPRRIDGDGGGSSKRLSVARPRRRRARPNAPCAMLHRGDAGILRSLSLMIPSSPRLVAFAQSECDLTTPIVKDDAHRDGAASLRACASDLSRCVVDYCTITKNGARRFTARTKNCSHYWPSCWGRTFLAAILAVLVALRRCYCICSSSRRSSLAS